MPDWKQYVRDNLPPLALGTERELEMADEMAQHLEAVYEDALADGESEQDALNRTKSHIKDWHLLESELIRSKRPVAAPLINNRLAREARIQSQTRTGGIGMGSLAQDLKYGVRMLLKSKGLTAIAVMSLAVGIGASTAIFSLIDAVLLKDLPVKNANELVLFDWLSGPKLMAGSIDGHLGKDDATGLSTSTSFSYATFTQFRDNTETLSDVFAFTELDQLNVNVDGQAEMASAQLVSGGYYQGLGVPSLLGRTIVDDDDQPGAESVTVISHRYWQRRFNRDPAAIGKRITINNASFTIIGVTPEGFEGTLQVGSSPDFSIPIAMEPLVNLGASRLHNHGSWWLQIMGRLKAGASVAQTRSGLEGIFLHSAIEENKLAPAADPTADYQEPDLPALRVGSGRQGLNEMRSNYAQPLTILTAVVGLVLLIACANVANLLLARGATRQKEMAVRLALGAGRLRLVRQMLTESMILATAGGMLGVVLANWGKNVLLTLRPWGGGALDLDLKLDLRVLGFTAAISLLTGVLFGVAPALRATRVDLSPALKDNARAVVHGSRFGLTKALVVAQVALSLVLLAGAGLFVRTLRNLNNVDVGFNVENLLLFKVSPRLSGYKTQQIPSLYDQMLERIEAVPGVVRATISRHPLLSGSAAIDKVFLEGRPAPGERDYTYVQRVRSNFFETMGIPLVLGRGLSERDDESAPRVAVINQTMATRSFPGEDPIGKRLGFNGVQHNREIEIVGVVSDAKYSTLRGRTPATLYFPYKQQASSFGGQMNFEVRTAGDPTAIVGAIREAVSEVDKNLPLFDITTQRRQIEHSLAQERLFASLSSFFGLLALLLACIGLYGVMSYAVARRTNEIGIRMALGATAPRVTRMVMGETMLMVFIGVVIGLGAALASTQLIESMLFGLAPRDPLTISSATVLMIAVAGVAGYLPARRASRVDPMVALRYE
jgi:predicted permease